MSEEEARIIESEKYTGGKKVRDGSVGGRRKKRRKLTFGASTIATNVKSTVGTFFQDIRCAKAG